MTDYRPPVIRVGDTVSIDLPDRRLWPRFAAWWRGLSPPVARRYFSVAADFRRDGCTMFALRDQKQQRRQS